MAAFLAMGGYAGYVWPAYGITALVLVGLALTSVVAERRARRQLAALEQRAPRRRRA
jgi:heme exporter protein D